jgi:hypothetical protein
VGRVGRFLWLWLLPLWVTFDVSIRPAAAFATARHRKMIWLLPGPLAISSWFVGSAWFAPLAIALLLAAAYLAKVRDMVRVAQGLHRESS